MYVYISCIFVLKDRDLYTPLHAAAASGNVECMHTLIKAGADIEAKNVYGNTALHIACLNGYAHAVTELITNNVNLGMFSIFLSLFLVVLYCRILPYSLQILLLQNSVSMISKMRKCITKFLPCYVRIRRYFYERTFSFEHICTILQILLFSIANKQPSN